MRIGWKLAILRSGRKQFEIARQIRVSESRLSRFVRGLDVLKTDEVARLAQACGGAQKPRERR